MISNKTSILAVFLLMAVPSGAYSDSICGPGLELASNAWACVPATNRTTVTTQSSRTNRTAANLGAAASALQIISILAGQLTPTDNLGEAELDTEGHGTMSRNMNRNGFRSMQKGNFKAAAMAFKLAAKEAKLAQNWKEAIENDKNWAIAVAHDHLKTAIQAETKGKIKAASLSYHAAIAAAQTVGDQALVAQLKAHHDQLVGKAKLKGKSNEAIPTNSQCRTINGKLRCQ